MAIINIITGWANLLRDRFDVLPDDLKQMAEERLIICNSCHMREQNTCMTNRTGINIETGKVRKGCGCNLSAKTLDPNSECPLAKWKKKQLD